MNASDFYQQRCEQLDATIRASQALCSKLVFWRGALGLPGTLLLGYAFFGSQPPTGTWQLGALLLVGFLAVATWHENVLWRMAWMMEQRRFYGRMIARCERRWSDLPALATEFASTPFASELTKDLDVLGDRSLFRWLSIAATESGAARVAAWLTEWAPSETLVRRQEAVNQLASRRAWRQSFWESALAFQSGNTRPEAIAEWGKSTSHFKKYPGLSIVSKLAPMAAVAGAIAIAVGIASGTGVIATAGFFVLLAALVVNLGLTVFFMGPVHDVFVRIGGANRELQALSELIVCSENMETPVPLLSQIRSQLINSNTTASHALSSLRRRMRFAGIQRNPLFFLPYLALQLTVLWDLRVLESLERWRKLHGERIADWIDAIAQLEALCCAAAVADENPTWVYPEWKSDASPMVRISGLGHPLLRDASRVTNDLGIERSHPLLLVTGSNMAGKSTLLRSLGVNILLSRLGAPAACSQWVAPNYELASSIRVQDSLQDGVSFFMAELKRLRQVVEMVRQVCKEQGTPMLALLDEILQGTNSRERQIAVQSVLQQLVDLGCTVAASTHDLELADVEGIVRRAQVVHFREYFEVIDGKQQMRFDYKMRPGVTPTTNALKLLEMVGLRSSTSNENG